MIYLSNMDEYAPAHFNATERGNPALQCVPSYYYYCISACLNQVEFKISQLAISGLKVNRLDMYGEVSHTQTRIGTCMGMQVYSITVYVTFLHVSVEEV